MPFKQALQASLVAASGSVPAEDEGVGNIGRSLLLGQAYPVLLLFHG